MHCATDIRFDSLCLSFSPAFSPRSINSWFHQHTIGHHIFTNVNGVDPDVPAAKDGDIRRISSYQNWAPAYRFQHLYLPFLYGFLGFKFRIQVQYSRTQPFNSQLFCQR